MTRAKWNAVVDLAALAAFAAVVSTGLLLRFQLPPGSGGGHGPPGWARGGAHAVERPSAEGPLAVWGLTRHDWGTRHFVLALGLLGILALHLVLHASWIACMIRGKPTAASARRLALGVLAILALLALALAPLAAPVEVLR
jgi:hypothetical protein